MAMSHGKGTAVSFIAGAVSASCTTVMFQPFDLVKTRMQVRSMPLSGSPVLLSTGNTITMANTFMSVVQKETVAGLWKGVSPSLQRCVPGIGMYFASLHSLKQLICNDEGRVTAGQGLLIGATARSMAAATFLPVTVVKTRYESGKYAYNSVFHGLRSIWRLEGMRGLYSGMSATLARDAPFSAVYYMLYSQLTQFIAKTTGESHISTPATLLCGITAGLAASVTTQPFDVVKTRMQLKPSDYQSFRTTFVELLSDRKIRELFSGLAPRATRRTLMAAFTWAFYEEIFKFANNFINDGAQ